MSEVNRYFYVMWPEEREASSTSSPSSLPARAATSVAVAVENGTENVVKVQGNGPIVSSTPLRLAYTHQDLRSMHSNLPKDEEDDESPSGLLIVRPTADGPRHDLVRTTAGRSTKTTVPQVMEKATVAMTSGYCTRCMMKDSEIRRLKKRVEALEEQLCRALKTKRPKSLPSLDEVVGIGNSSRHSLVSTSPATSDGSECHELNNCVEISIRDSQETLDVDVVKGHQVSGSVQAQEDDKIELVPGTNLFISANRLQQILSTVKTGKQLARKLMSVFWDRNTLARSTLSASSQHYEQLDPSTVSAIKTYCVLFDNSVRKSEIHSTMIDKCVQSRRPRRSSLKRLDYHEVKISPTLLLPSADASKTAPSFTCTTTQIQTMVKSTSEPDGSGDKPSD